MGKNLEEVVEYRISDDTGCRLIAILEATGGIVGIIAYFVYFGNQPVSLWLTLAFAPSLWGIYTGVELWKGSERGLKMAIWLIVIQIPVVMSPGVSYLLFLGASLQLGWLDEAVFRFGFGYSSTMTILMDPQIRGFAVNLLAVFMLLYLIGARKRLAESRIASALFKEHLARSAKAADLGSVPSTSVDSQSAPADATRAVDSPLPRDPE